jgi:hypothetical protein
MIGASTFCLMVQHPLFWLILAKAPHTTDLAKVLFDKIGILLDLVAR